MPRLFPRDVGRKAIQALGAIGHLPEPPEQAFACGWFSFWGHYCCIFRGKCRGGYIVLIGKGYNCFWYILIDGTHERGDNCREDHRDCDHQDHTNDR